MYKNKNKISVSFYEEPVRYFYAINILTDAEEKSRVENKLIEILKTQDSPVNKIRGILSIFIKIRVEDIDLIRLTSEMIRQVIQESESMML
jgi:hypothetical protein